MPETIYYTFDPGDTYTIGPLTVRYLAPGQSLMWWFYKAGFASSADALNAFTARFNTYHCEYLPLADLLAKAKIQTEEENIVPEPETMYPTVETIYYSVDLSHPDLPVRYLLPDEKYMRWFPGPFADPGEAVQEFKAHYAGEYAFRYLVLDHLEAAEAARQKHPTPYKPQNLEYK